MNNRCSVCGGDCSIKPIVSFDIDGVWFCSYQCLNKYEQKEKLIFDFLNGDNTYYKLKYLNFYNCLNDNEYDYFENVFKDNIIRSY